MTVTVAPVRADAVQESGEHGDFVDLGSDVEFALDHAAEVAERGQ